MSIDCKQNVIAKSPSGDKVPTSAIVDALTTCISSIHYAFDIITGVEPDRLTCLPTVTLARTSYPVVSLIKIYSLLTAPESQIGQVIDMQSLKLEYYLDHIINHYRKAASLDGGRAAAKFGNIITMLRNWFGKKKENGPALREMFGTELHSDSPDQNPVLLLIPSLKQPSNMIPDETQHQSSRTSQRSSIIRPNQPRSLNNLPPTPTPKPNNIHPINPNPRPTPNSITQPNNKIRPIKPHTKARNKLANTK